MPFATLPICDLRARFAKRSALAWLLLVAVTVATRVRAGDFEFARDVQPLLAARCSECHGGDEPAQNIDFTKFSDPQAAARQRKLWRRAIAQIEAGTMPPADETPLTPDERAALLGWMQAAIRNIDPADPANRDPGPAPLRRLSLHEYNRTIRDLLGFEFDAATTVGMTDEVGDSGGYANMAASLDLSPSLLDKYFAAADEVLDRLFGTELNSFVDGNIIEAARETRERIFDVPSFQWRKLDLVVAPPEGVAPRAAAERIIGQVARRAYRGQATPHDIEQLLTVYDHASSQDKSYVDSVRLMLKAMLVAPKFLYRVETASAASKPGDAAPVTNVELAAPVSDIELATRLSYFLWFSMPDDELLDLAERGKLSDPGPSSESLKLNSTVISAPGTENLKDGNRERAFDGDLSTFFDVGNIYWIGHDLGEVKPISRIRFAARRGLEDRMIGGRFQASQSPTFDDSVIELFEVTERPPAGWIVRDLPQPVTGRYVRYVPPPNSFGNIAEFEVRGFSSGTVFEQQLRRMLADPRARALTDHFAARWLQLTRLPTARPSVEFFPDFSGNVRTAMYEETALFFDGLRREDRSVLELLDADYTYLNEELAKFYGIADVQGPAMRRVALKPEYHRGGLLGMGSMLALTSHTSRTSPTLRGKWILEVLWGAPPPPPPANAGLIKDEPGQAKAVQTFREKLAQHAQNATCAACHHKMDPLGFALDNYNAVGQWREKAGDLPLDVTGELPGGEKLNGVADLKRVVAVARKDAFVRQMAEQMLTYALGRELDFYDDGPVQEIVSQLAANNYRFSTLVAGVANSYPFRYRQILASGN